MFVDRRQELAFLNSLLNREHPGPAQLVLLYGRRRAGKTELLLHWARDSSMDFTYWAAADLLEGKKHILILDELSYTAEADPAMLSALPYDQCNRSSES